MIQSRGISFIVAGVACAGLLVGCGSSSSSSSSSGSGDKATFCADNAKLDQATNNASTPQDALAALKDNQSTINDFSQNAPSDIASDAKTLVDAANQAISSNDVTPMTSQAVQNAGKSVDSYCGQNADGSPASA